MFNGLDGGRETIISKEYYDYSRFSRVVPIFFALTRAGPGTNRHGNIVISHNIQTNGAVNLDYIAPRLSFETYPMHFLEKKFLICCRERGLIKPGGHLVIGVSGGADSMALLHLLAVTAPELGVTMTVAHVSHGLRPEAAAKEADLVRQASSTLNIECHTTTVDVAAHAKVQGKSVEEAARELRYAFFDRIATQTHATKIAVAHTADDQAEEVLLRMIRGAGRKGLSGMALLRDGKVVRPLLGIEKSQILSYVMEKGIEFVEDPSNNDRRFLRNKIRLDLLPYLAGFNPAIAQTLRQTANILQEEDALLDILAHEQYTRIVQEKERCDLPIATADCSALNRLPLATVRRVLEKMLLHVNAKPQFSHIESLRRLATSGSGQLHLPRGLRAHAMDNTLRLFYPWGMQACRSSITEPQPLFSIVITQPGVYPIPEAGIVLRIEKLTRHPGHALSETPNSVFDLGINPFPLVVRNRLPGDTMQPAGSRRQPQKVSDILCSKKIPRQVRNTIPLVVFGTKIVAVPGICIDQGAQATQNSKVIVKVTTSAI